MSQSYLNCPSVGRAISAEEFAALGGGPGAGFNGGFLQSGQNGNGQQNMCCCCGPENGGGQQPPAPGCCCPPGGNGQQNMCCCGPENGGGQQPPVPGCCCPPGGNGQQNMCCCGPENGGGQQPPAPGCCCPPGGPCQCMMCCCQPVCPPPKPVQVEEGCCCKKSFQAALQLLCNPALGALLDFSSAAFITDGYTAGATLDAPAAPGTTPADNLSDDLTGVFRRFTPCTPDLLDITAPVYQLGETTSVFTAAQMSLCALDAIAIQAIPGVAEGELSAEEVAARNFRTIQAILSAGTTSCNCGVSQGGCCDPCCCSCGCDDGECCCAKGLLCTLAQGNLSRQVSLVAGPLVLTAVTLLGTVGNVLVLANDTDDRIYFVCVNSVQFLA